MYGFKIMVEGKEACFTRPEFKMERVSYDVPTPSAMEGMLKSIYWKPAIRYVIDKIIVFNPITFENLRRNEMKADCSRTQRNTLRLTNVKYGIEFHFELTGYKSTHEDECDSKHYNIIKRRIKSGKDGEGGQCFRTLYFGCKEFGVKRINLVDKFPMNEISTEILNAGDVDLGYMLYGLNYKDHGKPINGDWNNPIFSDEATPIYYRPHMVNGVIDVKKYREETICS